MGKYPNTKRKRVTGPQANPTETILESISDGVFTVDMEWRITSFNRAAEEITGVSRKEAIGRRCSEVFRCSMCEAECALRRTMKSKKPVIGKSGYIINADGHRIPISVSTAVLRDAEGRIIGGAETFRDLSEVEALRRELEGRFSVGDLVSHSPLMQRVFEVLPAINLAEFDVEPVRDVIRFGQGDKWEEVPARHLHFDPVRRRGDCQRFRDWP